MPQTTSATTIHVPRQAPATARSHTRPESEAQSLSRLRDRVAAAQNELTSAKPGCDLRRVQIELANAETALHHKLAQVTDRIARTEQPQMPIAHPRSTDRVSYSIGRAYTFSSSPPTRDASRIQRHTHRYTDAAGSVVSASTEHVGAQECAESMLLVANDRSVHLHVHIFNDPSARVLVGARRPMHLYIDPDAPRTHAAQEHGEYRLVQTHQGPKLMVEPTAAERAQLKLRRAMAEARRAEQALAGLK